MTSINSRALKRARVTAAGLGLLTASLVPGLIQLPAFAAGTTSAAPSVAPLVEDLITPGDAVAGLADLDLRGVTSATTAQRKAAAALNVQDVRWNQFGTPASLLPRSGSLGKATSADPATAARAWLRQNAAVLGISAAQVDGLDLVSVSKFSQSNARAVLFRQRFGDLVAATGGMVTVGVANGQIAYVSSSLNKTSASPVAAQLSPIQAWLKAAANVDRAVPAAKVADITSSVSNGFTRLRVPGFAQEQQVRLRALAMADGSVRPVFESNVVHSLGADVLAYTSMVDAVTGKVLLRRNQVDNEDNTTGFSGSTTAGGCGPKHSFTIADDATKQIVAVSVGVPVDDHVVKIFDDKDNLLTSGDLGTNPEYAIYQSTSIPAGTYKAQVCPYDSPTVPANVGPYVLSVTWTNNAGVSPGNLGFNPRWRFFTANPALASVGNSKVPNNSSLGCYTAGPGCNLVTGQLKNVQAPGPWDTISAGGTSTQTTAGNNALTREAWASPLTPGGLEQAPIAADRDYSAPFTDAWDNSKCNPSELVPGGNDILASVTNLFAVHNRMHDYSYYLGFTESNWNMQVDNLGRGGVAGDPEVGNVQAGALSGGTPTYLGRDNANQITLQDGVPGITNQYLFQPLAGAFYSPCTDGGLDMSIVGHEYTHAISNRMIGGPDDGITSEQGGAMGESWGDLVAAEYMFSHGYSTGSNPWAVGPYATGNPTAGIRDFPINKNPLNYSDYGFDSTGAEVHADGEIWNATQWSVRQALVKKYNKSFPYKNKALQLKCAQATDAASPVAPQYCPGNRRWVQLMFDAFLLQQGATSMLDARDAMLAADKMRFGGKDLKVMWQAFATRGMGKNAKAKNADDTSPTPSFASPKGKNGKVVFKTRNRSHGKVYVGVFEARAQAVADTNPKTRTTNTVRMAPGKYQMLYVGRTRGFHRFNIVVKPGKTTVVKIKDYKNVAAKYNGAKVIGTTAGSLNANALIDVTERTNWAGITADNVDVTKPFVAVDLAGKKKVQFKKFAVSAYLTPAPADPNALPLFQAEDPDSGSRFTALRRFALDVCVAKCSSATGAQWKRVFVSKADAFPAVAPRPVAPNLNLRHFSLKKKVSAKAVRLVVLENQCTGAAAFAGEQENDPTAETDCKTASDRGTIVHASELQIFDTQLRKSTK